VRTCRSRWRVESGGRHYLASPFARRRIAARLRAVLRRPRPAVLNHNLACSVRLGNRKTIVGGAARLPRRELLVAGDFAAAYGRRSQFFLGQRSTASTTRSSRTTGILMFPGSVANCPRLQPKLKSMPVVRGLSSDALVMTDVQRRSLDASGAPAGRGAKSHRFWRCSFFLSLRRCWVPDFLISLESKTTRAMRCATAACPLC